MPIEPMQEVEALTALPGRAPGSDAERRAARQLVDRLQAIGRDADTEPTRIHPNYGLAHALHAVVAIVGSVLSVSVPAAGAALVLLATASAFGDLTGTFFLGRRLTGRRASQNVVSEEDGGKPATLVLLAHYDTRSGRALPLSVFFWAMVVVLLCTIVRLVGLEGVGLTVVQFIPTVVLIASVPFLVDVAFARPDRGANDNASGVATVLRLAERYGGSLEHFDLWVLLPGADTVQPLGTREWLRSRRRELDPEQTVFVEVDAVGSGNLRWVEREGAVIRLRFHPELVRLCEELGDGEAARSREAGSALAARSAGYPAITITGGRRGDHVDRDALERAYDFCCALVERLDSDVGPELA